MNLVRERLKFNTDRISLLKKGTQGSAPRLSGVCSPEKKLETYVRASEMAENAPNLKLIIIK